MQRGPGDPGETAPFLPVETLRHWYLTVCGGRSPELSFGEIGLHREALARNTSLEPGTDRVRVAVVGRRRRPYLMDRTFEVVPLDEHRPKAAALSTHGEAVFPEGDDVVRPHATPQVGDEVILNAVLSQRLGALPDTETFAKILAELFRKGYGQDPENS